MKRLRMVATVVGGLGLAAVLLALVPASWWSAQWNTVAANWPLTVTAVVSLASLIVGGAAGCVPSWRWYGAGKSLPTHRLRHHCRQTGRCGQSLGG